MERVTYVDKPYVTIVPRPVDVCTERISVRSRVVDCDEADIGRYPDAEVLPTQVTYRTEQ